MATSHYCNGSWRDGPVSACNKHKKLSSKQATVYRGAGSPGGFSGKAPETSSSKSSSGGSGSSEGGSSNSSSSSGSSASGSSSSGGGD